ncbi:MAG: hypothetical protein WA715_06140 [Candidatus Acidiferrum sp.]|jgi:hypothetical protein
MNAFPLAFVDKTCEGYIALSTVLGTMANLFAANAATFPVKDAAFY